VVQACRRACLVTTPMARHRSVAFVVTPIPLCGCYVEVKIAL
jgi:hypothetical protein